MKPEAPANILALPAAATAIEADEAKGIKAQKPPEWKANALRHSYASYRLRKKLARIGSKGRNRLDQHPRQAVL
ncbi:MAG: hypothetical protein ACLQM8_19475 [Limisphaerales bacterium]